MDLQYPKFIPKSGKACSSFPTSLAPIKLFLQPPHQPGIPSRQISRFVTFMIQVGLLTVFPEDTATEFRWLF